MRATRAFGPRRPASRPIRMVRSRGLEPPRCYPLAPQASASTNSATTACEEECRKSRRLATRHVTNRSGRDKCRFDARQKRRKWRISALIGRARHHFLDLDGDAVAAHHDGAPRHRKVIDEDFHLIFFRRIKLDDGAA